MPKRLLTILFALLGLAAAGTVGFRWTTGASWIECLYQSVIILTTVGSREPQPLSKPGMVFIIVYLVCGLGVFTYSAFQLGQWIVDARLHVVLERRRMEKQIDKLADHFIVCGNGRMGRIICSNLAGHHKPFVVIDADEEQLLPICAENGWLWIQGDATNDEVLVRAGIRQARALTSVLPTDADNVYVVLSARLLNSSLEIIVRASEEKAVEKMQRAGANRVINPISSGAVKMARFMINPGIEDFLEIADTRDGDLELADLQISDNSPYVGKPLMETDLRQKGIMVIGIHRANGERLLPPEGTAVIQSGDCLFAVGGAEAINEMIGSGRSAG